MERTGSSSSSARAVCSARAGASGWKPCRRRLARPRRLDQRAVQGPVLGPGHQLGVPLHAQGKAIGQLDRLDHAVRGERRDHRGAGVADGLVVRGVHLDDVLAHDPREERAGDDARGMTRLARVDLLLVIGGAGHLLADILPEGAAQLDGQELHAPADAEHRLARLERRSEHGLLEAGA